MSSRYTTVRLIVDGEHFEILVNPDPALNFKLGKQIEPSQVIAADEVFSDSSKGLRVGTEKLRKYFKTEDSADGTKTYYAATNVEIFLGEGPYRNEDGSLNPNALGVVVTNGTVGVVRFNNNPYPRYETWQMGRDGSRQRVVARCCESKSDTYANSAYGFTTVGLSTDGMRLLACMPSEFACTPIAIDLPGGRQHVFSNLGNIGTSQEVSWALDLTRDGRTALIFIRPANDGPGPWLLYAVPFTGGKPTLLARNALDGRWRH